MDDSISRQAAIDAALKKLTRKERTNLLHMWSTVEVKYWVTELLENLPSAKPEIIRCKDCIGWDSDIEWCNRHGGTMQENDFCSRAGRRTDG